MAWDYPSLVVTCDRCGETAWIDGDSTTSGHWMYPTPDEVGWHDGDEGLLCPDCLAVDAARKGDAP